MLEKEKGANPFGACANSYPTKPVWHIQQGKWDMAAGFISFVELVTCTKKLEFRVLTGFSWSSLSWPLFVGCVLLIRPRSGKRGGRVPCSRFRPQRLDFHHTHFPKCNTEAPRFALRFWVAQRFQRCGSSSHADRL